MRAEVLIPRPSWRLTDRASLYSYTVPEHLADHLLPGQIVAVPFGERETAGVIWSLDASDDAGDPDEDDESYSAARHLVAAAGRTGALAGPARAGGMDGGVLRRAARHDGEAHAATGTRPRHSLDASSNGRRIIGSEDVPPDAAMLLAMLRERGASRASRSRGARHDTGAPRDPGAARCWPCRRRAGGSRILCTRSPRAARSSRRHRDALTRWREEARIHLGEPVSSSVHTSPRGQRRKAPEQTSERVLSQLATLDALEQNATSRPAWKIGELQRLTRVTAAELAELAAAGLIAIEEVAARRDPLAGRRYPRTQPLSLTAEQSAALKEILASARPGGGTFLLHGVTGSGKTEVYLQALAAVIAQGKRGIVLVPEIALTPQAVARYAGRFPGRVALLHSGLTDAERLDEWRRIRAGEVDVVRRLALGALRAGRAAGADRRGRGARGRLQRGAHADLPRARCRRRSSAR